MDENFYRRRLPHFLPDDSPYFIATRLHGSIPFEVLKRMRFERDLELRKIAAGIDPKELDRRKRNVQKRHFANLDKYLDGQTSGPTWLKRDEIAATVHKHIFELEEDQYTIWASTIMSNHIHLLCSLQTQSKPLFDVMRLLKGRSAYRCNRILGRRGSFWQDENYDHVAREYEFGRIASYIVMNPVVVGLVKDWRDWKWSYLHPSFEGM